MKYSYKSKASTLAGFAALAALVGCAHQPSQQTVAQMAKTESSIAQAEQAGAPRGALPELQQAKDKYADAQGALQRKDEQKAIRLAQQAQVDAQYAAAKAQAEQSQKAAGEVKEGVDTVKQTAETGGASPSP